MSSAREVAGVLAEGAAQAEWLARDRYRVAQSAYSRAYHGRTSTAHAASIVDGHAEAPELAAAVSAACMRMGLIVGGLRPGIREGNTLRLAPPLTATAGEIDEALSVLDAALAEVEAAWRR